MVPGLLSLLIRPCLGQGLRAQRKVCPAGVGTGPAKGGENCGSVRAYSLLEHEDANDEGEGDQVGSYPHETVLVRGL